MGSIIGHRIDYNGVGALRSQRHISSKKLIKYPPSPRSTHRSAGGVDKTKLGNAISPVKILSLQPSILLFLSDVSGVTSPKDMHSKKAGLINGRPSTFTTNYSGGGVLPTNRLMGMCQWTGSLFYGWIDYNRVAFS